MTNVVDLAARLALHESVRPFLTILDAAPKVADVLASIAIRCTSAAAKIAASLAAVFWKRPAAIVCVIVTNTGDGVVVSVFHGMGGTDAPITNRLIC